MEEFVIYKMSVNAAKAFEQGERLYHQWKKDEIIEQILQIQAEENIELDYDPAYLEKISEKVLREFILSKSSWHHVNGKCTWFYVINDNAACAVCRAEISRMIQRTRDDIMKVNKPRLASVRKTIWIEEKGHQFAKGKMKQAVVYNGNAYFIDGTKTEIRDGHCEVVKECKSIVKEKRNLFEKIIRIMRMNYGIAI